MKKCVNKLYSAAINSLRGLRVVIQKEFAFQLEVIAFLLLIPLVFFVASDALHRLLLISSVVLVMICELFNTAFEKTIDRIGLEQNVLSKQVKDIASSAVLVSIILAVVVWGWSIIEYFSDFEY